MGGIWGLASSTALENLPVEIRGLASGVLQEGYALGCIIAAIINLTLVPEKEPELGSDAWRSLFWVASGLSFLAAVFTMMIPESQIFDKAKRATKGMGVWQKSQVFMSETRKMMKLHWKRFIYVFFLLTGGNHILSLHMRNINFIVQGLTSSIMGHKHVKFFAIIPVSLTSLQDLYPTYLRQSKGFNEHDSTMATLIGFCVSTLIKTSFASV